MTQSVCAGLGRQAHAVASHTKRCCAPQPTTKKVPPSADKSGLHSHSSTKIQGQGYNKDCSQFVAPIKGDHDLRNIRIPDALRLWCLSQRVILGHQIPRPKWKVLGFPENPPQRCMYACMHECVCVCVCEREKESGNFGCMHIQQCTCTRIGKDSFP